MPISDLLAAITGESSSTSFPTPHSPPKRKANDDLRRPVERMQKTPMQMANSSRPIKQIAKPLNSQPSAAKAKVPQDFRSTTQNSPTSTFKNGQPTPPPTGDPPKVPKKGSFAEIMARGKAAQNTLGQIGKIQHKKIEKLPSRREREAMQGRKGKTIEKGLGPNSKFGAAGAQIRDGKHGAKTNGKTVEHINVEPEKKAKKAATATTGYAGTARPRPGVSNSSRLTTAGSTCDRDKFSAREPSRRYEYASEEDEDEEFNEDDYYSDESDMEAAAFEVDEEEELATRIARKEDAEALAEENQLKREKLEKKKRLEAMARKAPSQRY